MNDDFLKQIVKNLNLPGCSVCVETLSLYYCGSTGYLDDSKMEPYSDDTYVRIGCVVKLFVATQIMLLQQDGLIDINDPIVRYLGNKSRCQSRYLNEITFRQLMLHTSGLIVNPLNDDFTKLENMETYLSSITDEDWFVEEPGKLFSYSSLGYMLLAYLIELIRDSGSWMDDLYGRILSPLGIEPKCIDYSQRQGKKIYGVRLDGGFASQFTSNISPSDGGGLALTARNICDFGYIFINNGISRSGHNILSVNSVAEMLACGASPPSPTDGVLGFGYGWWISPDGSAGLNGDGTNNHACFRIDVKNKFIVALAANYHPASILFNSLLQGVIEDEDEMLISFCKTSIGSSGIDIGGLEGRYTNGTIEYNILRSDDYLKISRSSNGSAPEISEFKFEDENSRYFLVKAFGKFPEIHPIKMNHEGKYSYIWNGAFACKKVCS